MTAMTVVAVLIFLATLTLVIWQPKGLGIGWSALGGAAVALITTVVSLSDIPVVWDIVWNATFAFVAIVIISLILDESGFFTWAALHVARWGRGNGRLLFALIVLLGAAIAATIWDRPALWTQTNRTDGFFCSVTGATVVSVVMGKSFALRPVPVRRTSRVNGD